MLKEEHRGYIGKNVDGAKRNLETTYRLSWRHAIHFDGDVT